jgi:hypothetical protein
MAELPVTVTYSLDEVFRKIKQSINSLSDNVNQKIDKLSTDIT